jgi:hypothetical protein
VTKVGDRWNASGGRFQSGFTVAEKRNRSSIFALSYFQRENRIPPFSKMVEPKAFHETEFCSTCRPLLVRVVLHAVEV